MTFGSKNIFGYKHPLSFKGEKIVHCNVKNNLYTNETNFEALKGYGNGEKNEMVGKNECLMH